MSTNNNFAEECWNIRNGVTSVEEFTEEVLEYFKICLKDSVHCRTKDQSDLVHRSREHFDHLLKDQRFEEIFTEVLFSVLENFPFTSHRLIYEVLEDYLLRKMEKYHYMKNVLIQYMDLRESPLSNIDFYLEPTDEFTLIVVEYFCSSPMILDICVMQRWLRYGGRFLIYPLETQFYLKSILSCLTVKLLPLLYKYTKWDATRVIVAYETYREQRRLYLVLLFVYVILQSNKPKDFPKWRSSLRSLKLVFKAITEPFITAQEIDRFICVASVPDDLYKMTYIKVSNDLCKKFAVEFPNIKEPSGPRSLKQISRCAVRDVLIKSETLPHGVWYLDIPTVLKNYLLLQEREDEFYPAHVHALCSRKRSAPHQISAKKSRTSV